MASLATHARLFTDRYLEKKMGNFSLLHIPDFEQRLARVREWQAGIESQRILGAKEEQLQDDFLKLFFGDVLGYRYRQDLTQWNLEREYKTRMDGTKADGALGYFSLKDKKECHAVIELKDARCDLDKAQNRKNDRRTPVQQAFDYANAIGSQCKWVIVSNFLEIRLYAHTDRTRYEHFDILKLSEEQHLKRFFFLLDSTRLIHANESSAVELLYQQRQQEENQISTAFYNEYKTARAALFTHLHHKNPDHEPLLLLNKTQKLLDRMTFIWFCEDFQIIPAYTLRHMLQAVKQDKFNRSDTKIWDRIRGLFEAIDQGNAEAGIQRFNGGLFAEDALLNDLVIEDRVLADIVGLEKYDFASDLDVNILGHIFEQSISDLEALKASIENQDYDLRKGLRKQSGIFYTPAYITQYVVEQTVGVWLEQQRQNLGEQQLPALSSKDYDSVRLLKGKLKANASIQKHIDFWEAYRHKLTGIKVLDPACGSGAFLNQVFDYLYQEGQKVNKTLAQLKRGQREAFDLDHQILSENIYGVDLNAESIEITRLSLWLKTANNQKSLTSLDHTIRQGNSLVSDTSQAHAFDWQAAFPEVMAQGGFDVVVGNPPYVRHELFSELKAYLQKNYAVYHGMADLFVYFFEKGLRLLKPGGMFGYIVSNKFLRAAYGSTLTQWLQQNATLQQIIDFGDLQIFEGATTFPCIITLKNQKPELPQQVNTLLVPHLGDAQNLSQALQDHGEMMTIEAQSEHWVIADPEVKAIIAQANVGSLPLKQWLTGEIYYGIKTGFNQAFVINQAQREALIAADPRSAEVIKPYLVGKDLFRYGHKPSAQWLIVIPAGWTNAQRQNEAAETYFSRQQPAIYAHFQQIIKDVETGALKVKGKGLKNRDDQGDYWWELRSCAYYPVFEQPKLMYSDIATEGQFYLDTKGYYSNNTIYMVDTDSAYVLAVLNSKPISFLFKQIATEIRGGFLRWFKQYVEILPIPQANEAVQAELGALALALQAQTQEREHLRHKALQFLKQELGLSTWPAQSLALDLLSIATVFKILKKQKITLTLSQKEEWSDWLAQKQQHIQTITTSMAQLDSLIDQKVAALYGFTTAQTQRIQNYFIETGADHE